MGLINGSLQIGRSAITASQAALQVIGNNVANSANPDYARQKPVLGAVFGGQLADGIIPGLGVNLTTVQRMADNAINARLRSATGEQASADAVSTVLRQAETVLNALGEDNLSTRLRDFFNAFDSLANEPQSSAQRTMVLQAGGALTRTLTRYQSQLLDARQQVNSQIRSLTDEVNRLVNQAAQLNGEITRVEFGLVNATAGTLHDQRDAVLARLGELVDVTTHTGDGGAINVYLGSTPLVMAGDAFTLHNDTDTSAGYPDTALRFDHTGAEARIAGGRIGGLMAARDGIISDTLTALDTFGQALINEVNRIHSSGQGLEGFTSIKGIYAVDNATAALNEAGLSLTPVNGTFQVHVTNQATGARTSHLVEVDLDGVGADTTLTSLAASLDALDGVSASVGGDGKLTLTAGAGATLSFSDDTSGALAALGINVFFQGSGSSDIAVRSDLRASQIAAGANHSPADNSNAQALAVLGDQTIAALGGASLSDYYEQVVTELSSATNDAGIELEASSSLVETLRAQRDAVSGVNVDEEAIDLMRYQRSFQGASHYLSLVNQLLAEMMNLI